MKWWILAGTIVILLMVGTFLLGQRNPSEKIVNEVITTTNKIVTEKFKKDMQDKDNKIAKLQADLESSKRKYVEIYNALKAKAKEVENVKRPETDIDIRNRSAKLGYSFKDPCK